MTANCVLSGYTADIEVNNPSSSEDIYTYLLAISKREGIDLFHENLLSMAVLEKAQHYTTNESRILKRIWGCCTFTAPVVFSQIVPEASYSDKEKAILELCIQAIDPHANPDSLFKDIPFIEHDFENFGNLMRSSGERTFVCGVFGRVHCVVIKKTNRNECLFLQSFVNEYSLQEFLEKNEWHTKWTPNEVVDGFRKIITKETQMEERINSFQKFFFSTPKK